MTRDDVLAVVRRHTLEVLIDVDPAEFDANRSLREVGAKSLDVLEIVSSSMKSLKIKVPRPELVDVQTVNQLVDVFYAHVQKRA
ncbi:MAG: acyl carrier protein [Deltaproteobacteria bacterium]|nr:acyl carrier protein [Deltaproteobacteria bacterium]